MAEHPLSQEAEAVRSQSSKSAESTKQVPRQPGLLHREILSQNKTKQNKTKQNKTKQNKTKQNGANQNNPHKLLSLLLEIVLQFTLLFFIFCAASVVLLSHKLYKDSI